MAQCPSGRVALSEEAAEEGRLARSVQVHDTLERHIAESGIAMITCSSLFNHSASATALLPKKFVYRTRGGILR
jgi:hypothetical protein